MTGMRTRIDRLRRRWLGSLRLRDPRRGLSALEGFALQRCVQRDRVRAAVLGPSYAQGSRVFRGKGFAPPCGQCQPNRWLQVPTPQEQRMTHLYRTPIEGARQQFRTLFAGEVAR